MPCQASCDLHPAAQHLMRKTLGTWVLQMWPAERNVASRTFTWDKPTSFAMARACCNAAGKSHQPAFPKIYLTPLPLVLRAQEFLLAQHNIALGLLSRSHCQELLLASEVDEVQQHLELTLWSMQLLGKHSALQHWLPAVACVSPWQHATFQAQPEV